MGKIQVYFQKLSDDVVTPTYADEWDSGMDIRSTIDVDIYPHETKIIPTTNS